MRSIKKFPIGGTHLPEFKHLSSDRPIALIHPTEKVTIPLQQHIGVPCRSLVNEGDQVKAGDIIGMNDQGLSALIHSSVTGTVLELGSRTMVDGSGVECVIIAKDQEAEEALYSNALGPGDPVPDAQTVIQRVEQAGIVGMGGAAFPSHIKLQPKGDTKIDTIIINGAECEPYITTDDRLMQEYADAVFRGLEIIRRTVSAEKGYVACEINKPEALKQLFREAEKWEHLEAVRLDTRYPHGAEKHLIKAVLDREVPIRQLPMAVGVIVNNVQTAIAIAMAVDREQPLISRVLTVSGSGIRNPGNFLAPVGTPVRDLIDAAGGISAEKYRIIIGGPMTGVITEDLDLPITKSTSGIVVMQPEEYADRSSEVCIRCGKCVSVCPMYLQPNRVTAFCNNEMILEAEEFGLNDCILCGACSYVCPAKRPLLQWLRTGKAASAEIAWEKKQKAAKED